MRFTSRGTVWQGVMPIARVAIVLLAINLTVTGCLSAGMAAKGYDPGAAVLRKGVARQDVEPNLGRPISAYRLADGRFVAVYEYGRSRPDKGWEITHAFLGGVTLGAWELVGLFIESARASRGEKVRVTVTYGEDDRIVDVASP